MSKQFEEENDAVQNEVVENTEVVEEKAEEMEEKKVVRVNSDKSKRKFSIKEAIKKEFKSKKFKNGAYSSAIIAVILIAVVFVNLIVSEFDLTVDLSSESVYTLTDQTKEVVDALTDDITIYYIVSDGSEISTIENILKKYANLSDKVKLVNKDPDLYPTFINEYVGSTTTVTPSSVLVVNETKDTSKYVDYYDMIEYTTDYSSYYTTGSTSSTPSALDVEGQVTAAIQYVSNENNSKLYQVTGHGETELGDYMTNEFTKLCTEVDSFESRTEESVPDDCDILLINGPTTDFSESEVTMIKEYLTNGGKAIILANPSGTGLTNFDSLLEYYGIAVTDGLVVETSSYADASSIIATYPDIASTDITDGITRSTNPVLVYASKGLKETDTRDTVTFTDLLTSSDEAYCKVNLDSTTSEKEDGDVDGPFIEGVLVSETYDDVTTELVVLSSNYVIDDTYVQYESLGNAAFMNNIVSYLGGQETGLSIPTRSLSEATITTSSADVYFWSILLTVAIPAGLLATGFVIWYRRRKA